MSTKGQKKKKKREKLVSIDDEAEEESDEGDFESKEVDYSSSSSNNDDDERVCNIIKTCGLCYCLCRSKLFVKSPETMLRWRGKKRKALIKCLMIRPQMKRKMN